MTTIIDLLGFYTDYLQHERQLAAASITAYRRDLIDLSEFLGSKSVALIEVNDLRAYMRHLGQQGLQATSIRRKFHGYGTFWRWLKMEGYAADVITEQIRLPRKPQRVVTWLSSHELQCFVETPPDRNDPFERARDRLAWLLLAWLGLRRGEVLALDVPSVRLADEMIIIRSGKGNKDRVLPIPGSLKLELAAFIGDRTSGPLLPNLDGQRWKTRAFNRAFQRHLRACGLAGRGITPHTIRHTFATHLVSAGVPISTVSQLLGHTDIQSTMLYVHTDLVNFKNALAHHALSKLNI